MDIIKNFDFLTNMFKASPQAHHEWQADAIETYINSLPPDRAEKMKKFQQIIVDEMNECATNDERNQRMNNLFWEQTRTFVDSFDKLNKVINAPSE